MNLPYKELQIEPRLLFFPAFPQNYLGSRIRLTTRMPIHNGEPPLALDFVLRDLSSEAQKNKDHFPPEYCFVLEDSSSGGQVVQELLDKHTDKMKKWLYEYENSCEDPKILTLVRERAKQPPVIQLVSRHHRWTIGSGDVGLTLQIKNHGVYRALGVVVSLEILDKVVQ